ncbi:3-phytase A [Leucoagaricus sp. SymC.cos]|nr:3-phytase A [Leucoagaricus sp. SymC.cos]
MTCPTALFILLFCFNLGRGEARVSPIAGSTESFLFPPPGVTATIPDPYFPDGKQVGFVGPTPTGDEAAAMVTAPSFSHNHNQFPLVKPIAADAKDAKSFNVIRYFGNLSPWRSIPSSNYGLPEASPIVPDDCKIVQVHLLHRHGARYPVSSSSLGGFAAKIHEAANSEEGFEANGDLKFLRTWTYKLGAETLTPFGRAQLYELGVAFRVRYGELLKGFSDLPVFRTTSQSRMVDSALNFAAGFFGLPDYSKDYHQLIEVETPGVNSTLAATKTCPNAHNEISYIGNHRYAEEWVDRYLLDAQERLAKHLPGFNLTIEDCLQMQQLCAFETVALGYSKFCGLFTEEEWKGFAYANALQMWYGWGPGSPTSASIGKGYVQELVSRLTRTRISDFNSSVNQSIVSSETLFPFNQPIYVDATHDTVMSSIYVAMNFTNFIKCGPLPTDRIPALNFFSRKSYKMDEVMPFAANLVGQVLSCPASASNNTPTHIRWILNDGVLPLTGIKGCEKDKDGLCEISAFIDGMKQRIEEIDHAFGCFGNYTFPDPDLIVDGQMPRELRT